MTAQTDEHPDFRNLKEAFAEKGIELQPQIIYDDLSRRAVEKCSAAIADSATLVKTKGEAIIIMSMIAMEIFAGTMSFVTINMDDEDAAQNAIEDFAEVCRSYAVESRNNRIACAKAATAAMAAAES